MKHYTLLRWDILNLPIEQWKECIHNDFEDSIFPKFPEIKNIKEKLYSKEIVLTKFNLSVSSRLLIETLSYFFISLIRYFKIIEINTNNNQKQN